MSERGSGKETGFTLSTDALRPLMTKQQKTALNMAKFIQDGVSLDIGGTAEFGKNRTLS
ncbi:Rop family plasmid primer RNA-binding protein [Acinetobacter baumannii]|nr:Rop family plasmid primer RNA-binding protein [Acinetobacter baumannii]